MTDLPSPLHAEVPQTVIPLGAFEPDREPRVVEALRTLRRGWKTLAVVVAMSVLAVGAWVFTARPLYTAESTILIERRTPQVLEVRELLAEGVAGDEANFYRTQQEILQSRSLAISVIRDLALDRDAKFLARAKNSDGPIFGALTGARARLSAWLHPESSDARPAHDPSGIDPALLSSYRAGLEIAPVNRTRLVNVRFTSESPEIASQAANTHVRAYIHEGMRLRSQASEDARRFLEQKLVELKDRLETSEIALNAYRRDTGLLSLDDKENIVVERLSDLNRRLSAAEGERIASEAEVKLIKSRDFDSLPGVANSPLIQSIKGQLAEVERRQAEMSAQFKPGYPGLDQVSAQVREVRASLTREIQRVVGSIETTYLAAADRESELRKMMEEQKAETLKLKDAAVQYAILHRETDANRQLYDSVLQRMKEIGIAGTIQASNVSVIDEAAPPQLRSFPKRTRSLLLALAFGLAAGVVVVLGRNYLDSSIKGPEDVEHYLRLPNLGAVPNFDLLGSDAKGTEQTGSRRRVVPLILLAPATTATLATRSFSVVTESYRTLRTAILFSRAQSAPRTLLFTSAMDGEGKTTSSVNTAIVFAQLGARVLLVDADLRRSTCHRRLGLANADGLTNVLTGQRTFDEVLTKLSIDGVTFVSAGASPPNPTELVGSVAMRDFLTTAAQRFDYIILDSPPIMAVNDSVVLAPLLDGVVMVVKAHHTPRKILQRAETRLLHARAKILGVLLNRLDTRTDHYSTYYGGKYYSSYYEGSLDGVIRSSYSESGT